MAVKSAETISKHRLCDFAEFQNCSVNVYIIIYIIPCQIKCMELPSLKQREENFYVPLCYKHFLFLCLVAT